MNEAFALAAYGLRPGPLGVIADPFERAVYALSWQLQMRAAHDGCDLSAFCRNPLHPGPCKGWKHHLGLVSPGALHALEKARHDRLEERRKAKVAALLAEGKKVPAHLKKPIVYDPTKSPFINNPEYGKVTPGLGIPTQGLTDKAAQETLAKIPTKAQVGEKLDAKHAAEAAAEAKKINVGDAVQHKGSWNHHIVVRHNPDGTTTLEHAGTPGKGVTKVPTADLEKLTGEDAKKALAAHENAKLAGNPTMLTISKAGLKDGDQVFLHGTGDGSPKLVTVRKVIGGGGGMKAGKSVSYEFVGEDGKTLPQTAGASAKWALSPAPGKSFPEAGESKLGKLAAVAEHQGKAKAGADAMVLAAKLMSGKHLSDQAHGHLVVQLSGHHEAGSIADQADQFAPAAAKKLAAKAWKQTDINNHVHQAELEKALEKDIHDGIVKGEPTPVLHALADSLKTLGQDEQGADEKLAKAVAAKLGTKGSGPDVPDLGAPAAAKTPDLALGEAAAMAADSLNADEHHKAIINVAHQIGKPEFEKALTPRQQSTFLTKLDDAAQVAHENHDAATAAKADAAFKKLTGGTGPTATPIAPNPSASAPFEDISHVTKPEAHAPHVKEAVDYANGFKAGTDTKKLAAYQKLTQDEINQLDPNTKQLMKANVSKMATKFKDPKKKTTASDVWLKLNGSTGGAGAGGAGAADVGQDVKVKTGLDTVKKIQKALGLDYTASSEAAYKGMLINGHVTGDIHNLADTLSEHYAKQISNVKGDSLPEVHAELTKEINQGLKGEQHPTPLLDAAATGDTFNFIKAVHDHPITGPALKKAVGIDTPTAGEGGPVQHVVPTQLGEPKLVSGKGPGQMVYTTPKTGVLTIASNPGKSGDGFTDAGGKTVWGKYGAAGAVLRHVDENGTERFLLVQRGPGLDQAGKWQLPGGALDSLETPEQGAAREMHEELGFHPDYLASAAVHGHFQSTIPGSDWKYTSIAATVDHQEQPDLSSEHAQFESSAAKWLTLDEIQKLDKGGHLLGPLAEGKLKNDVLSLFHGGSTKSNNVIELKHGGSYGSGSTGPAITGDPKALYNIVKKMPKGNYSTSPPEDVWDNVVALAAHRNTTPMQILKDIDTSKSVDSMASKTSWEQKIRDWMGTSAGKTYVSANSTPKQELLDHLDGKKPKPAPASFKNNTGIPLKEGEKVPAPGGPGEFDHSLPEGHFVGHSIAQAEADQNAYKKANGIKFTPQQIGALKEYVDWSGAINTWLRDQQTPSQSSIDNAIYLQSMMMPTTRPHLLLRGTGWSQFPPDNRSFEGLQKLIGKTVEEPAFLSASVSGSGSGFHGDVKMHIEAPAGTMGVFTKDSQYKSQFLGSEAELLLAARTKMHITKVWKEGGQVHVLMRVVS